MKEKISIIENNWLLKTSLVIKLEKAVFEIVSTDADLYIFDLWLDDWLCWDLIESTRANTDALIIVYSWYSNMDYKKKALLLWCDRYINKVISPNELILELQFSLQTYKRLCIK